MLEWEILQDQSIGFDPLKDQFHFFPSKDQTRSSALF
jgi:hypothetical protein